MVLQAPNSKHQIPNNTQIPMTETQREMGKPSLGHLDIGYWDLFGA
jgi:hypothetical protein